MTSRKCFPCKCRLSPAFEEASLSLPSNCLPLECRLIKTGRAISWAWSCVGHVDASGKTTGASHTRFSLCSLDPRALQSVLTSLAILPARLELWFSGYSSLNVSSLAISIAEGKKRYGGAPCAKAMGPAPWPPFHSIRCVHLGPGARQAAFCP